VEFCLIGAGPRGLCVAERICANAEEFSRSDDRIVVHMVDPFVDRSGRVWDTAQPPSLLMNTIASQVTVFTDESVECAGPIVTGPSLHEWARLLTETEPLDGYPAWVRAEAATLGPDDYPSRAFYGHYLRWALTRLHGVAPKQVTIVTHPHRAVALADEPDGRQQVTLDNGERLAGLTAVVLAQGHLDMPPTPEEDRLTRYAVAHGLRYQPPANPVEADLSGIGPGELVGIRGMGLNFFDYIELLAHGRGGHFDRRGDDLVYQPSGQEPVIYAGSRRGVPYHARGDNEKGVSGRHLPVFLTAAVIDEFQARGLRGQPVEFRRDVWPLIVNEVELVYYSTLVARRQGPARAADFARCYTAAYPAVPIRRRVSPDWTVQGGPGDPATLELLDRFGIQANEQWDWGRVARTDLDRRVDGPADFRRWLLDRLRQDVAEARLGNVSSPLKAAVDVLRDIRNEIRLIVDHGGITGASYRDELQAWYNPISAMLSIGPPRRRIEEMIALIEAGVLHMLGPRMWVRPADHGGGFEIGSATVPQSATRVTTLIEARLPELDIRRTTDWLIGELLRCGQARPYLIPSGPDGDHETGGLAVTRRPYRLVDSRGRLHPRRFAYGVPTEAVHWVTAAGARPGVNSVLLGDADAIARAALALLSADVDGTPEQATTLTLAPRPV
jgi:hypothetical protein